MPSLREPRWPDLSPVFDFATSATLTAVYLPLALACVIVLALPPWRKTDAKPA